MTTTLQLLGGLGLLLASGLTPLAGAPLRGTTLRSAWWWSIAALASWWAAWVASWFDAPAVVDPLWYAAAVVSLCPFVQVLGARRPVSRSWTWFVILPMLAVLGLPLATSFGTESFEVELPPLLGFLLVLVMGAGNYFGTRFTGPVLSIAVGLAGVAVSGSTVRPAWFPAAEFVRPAAALLLGLGALGVARNAGTGADLHRGLLWTEFRDLFGIVWAKRVMDRVNDSLAAANSNWRLDLSGLRPAADAGGLDAEGEDSDAPPGEADAERVMDGTLSWLLLRFVDQRWADRFGLELRASAEPRAATGG